MDNSVKLKDFTASSKRLYSIKQTTLQREYNAKRFDFTPVNSEKKDAVNNFGFVKWGGKYANRLAF